MGYGTNITVSKINGLRLHVQTVMMSCVLCPPYIWGAASVSGRTVTKCPPGNPLTCDCRATELKQVFHTLCIQCIIHKKWEMHLTQLFLELRCIKHNGMQSWWISVKVLDGDLESSLFNIPSKELVCSNSGQLLRNMHFHQLNCPLEQEYPDQVCFHVKRNG